MEAEFYTVLVIDAQLSSFSYESDFLSQSLYYYCRGLWVGYRHLANNHRQ